MSKRQLLRVAGTNMTNPRQTASFLRKRFAEVGIRPDTHKGQNFLIDLNLVEILVDAAQLTKDDVVLEVGTGTGSLTALMAPQVAATVTVEIDPQLHVLAAEELIDCDNVTLLRGDVLRNKNTIHGDILAALKEPLSLPDRQLKLVSNLPYNIATPLISNLLKGPIVPVMMVVTIQKELADKITAVPRTKDYAALSVWIQSLSAAEILRILPPSVFWPRPKIQSAIIRIIPNDEQRRRIPDLEFFHTFVRALFLHRRKFLRSCLLSAVKNRLDKPEIDAIMNGLLLGATSRAEELSIDQIQQLSESVRNAIQVKESS